MKITHLPLLAVALFSVGCGTLQTEYEKQKGIIFQQKVIIGEQSERNAYLSKENERLKRMANAAGVTDQYNKELVEIQKKYRERLNKLMNALKGVNVGTGGEIPVVIRGSDAIITLSNKILFRSGESELSSSGRTTLQKVVRIIQQQYPSKMVRIDGHTDKQPINVSSKKNRSNWDLSAKRATRVVEYLEKQKSISAARLSIGAYSKYRPVRTGASDRENRRVEIVILDIDK